MSNNKKNNFGNESKVHSEEKVDIDIEGSSVFMVETTAVGVLVRAAFVSTDSAHRVLVPGALFPDLEYALDQIDQLKALVIKHFSDEQHVVGAVKV